MFDNDALECRSTCPVRLQQMDVLAFGCGALRPEQPRQLLFLALAPIAKIGDQRGKQAHSLKRRSLRRGPRHRGVYAG